MDVQDHRGDQHESQIPQDRGRGMIGTSSLTEELAVDVDVVDDARRLR